MFFRFISLEIVIGSLSLFLASSRTPIPILAISQRRLSATTSRASILVNTVSMLRIVAIFLRFVYNQERVKGFEPRVAAGRILTAWVLTWSASGCGGLLWLLTIAAARGANIPIELLGGLAVVTLVLTIALYLVILWIGLEVYRLVAGLADRD